MNYKKGDRVLVIKAPSFMSEYIGKVGTFDHLSETNKDLLVIKFNGQLLSRAMYEREIIPIVGLLEDLYEL